MANFGPKPWTNPLGRISIFRLFKLRVFFAQKVVFSFQNIVKHIFLPYICKRKQVGKMATLGPKPWTNPLGRISIFRLFKLLLFTAQKVVFSFQNIVKDIFLPYICKRKKVGKMATLGPKAWTNPFGKISIFQLFRLGVSISQKVVFSFQNIVKHIFLPYICKRKKVGKMATLGPKAWTNPFGKISIF